MAVAFDTKSTAVLAFTNSTATITKTDMTPGASATALVCFVDITTSGISSTLATVSTVTWNGVSMSLLASKLTSDSLSATYMFGLGSPATGNHNLVVTFTGGTSADNSGYVDTASFTGTALTTALAFPSGNVITDATTPSGTVYPTTAFSVTTVNGDAAVAVMQNVAFAWGSMNTGTLISADSAFNGNYTAGYKLATTTATTLQFAGGGSGSPCCGIAVRIAQPGGAITTVIPPWIQSPLPRKILLPGEYPFLAFTDIAKEDTARYEWTIVWEGPVRIRPTVPWQQFLALDPISLGATPGTGNLLWYMPLSGVMILNIIGSD